MNDLGVIASGIVTYDFPNDTGSYNMSFVSGWLETNIGELNGYIHEEFEVDSTGAIRMDGTGLAPVEINIFGTLYELWYYSKSARESLRSFTYSDSVDWVTIKEGDTTLQRQNKNSVAKTYKDLAEETSNRLDDLIFQYNYQKSSPLQVAGTDGTYNLSGQLV
mgnify:FL=1|tara:strand:+ start:1339 stop:1827 length:489 start_codon:yes stop_codon:yes gene_type:complete